MTFSLRFGKQLDDGLPDITYALHTMEYKFLKRAWFRILGNYSMKEVYCRKAFGMILSGGKKSQKEEGQETEELRFFFLKTY